MAKVKLNPVLQRVRGKVGDLVFKRYNDGVIMARKPDLTDNPPTEGQAAQRRQFKLATLYGRTVLADPVQKTVYEATAKAKGIPAFALTVGDFLNAPTVDEIDLSGYTGKAGETIRITASDDFEVTGVAVSITDAGGTVLENGPATAQNGTWSYTTTTNLTAGQPVSIAVTATDRPGHTGDENAGKKLVEGQTYARAGGWPTSCPPFFRLAAKRHKDCLTADDADGRGFKILKAESGNWENRNQPRIHQDVSISVISIGSPACAPMLHFCFLLSIFSFQSAAFAGQKRNLA
jgi:hypothetical protein